MGSPIKNEAFIESGLVAAVALFSSMMLCGIAEGIIDSNRAASGNVTPADVGQPQPR